VRLLRMGRDVEDEVKEPSRGGAFE